MKSELLEKINEVERIAALSKFGRLCNNPYKYISAFMFRKFIYPRDRKERIKETGLFYGKKMRIALPASTDIYLTGGKSHHSEIRLARFLISELNAGDHFLDIGAHFGYFTLLAAEMVGKTGKVFAFEPAGKSFALLLENSGGLEQVTVFRKAVSDKVASLVFYEFPNMQSEYNTADIAQFEQEEWFDRAKPERVEVQAVTIDHIAAEYAFSPAVIKIDVEGGEFRVMQGGADFFKKNNPRIVMEYLEPGRQNLSHRKAAEFLSGLGYKPYIIDNSGQIRPVQDIDGYMQASGMESDNIVFTRN